MNCTEVRLKIDAMFDNLTPQKVDETRSEIGIDLHLLKCPSCRAYLKESYCRKKKEFEEGKK
jgi:predicted anti-sigma-YlaC factor YlaD